VGLQGVERRQVFLDGHGFSFLTFLRSQVYSRLRVFRPHGWHRARAVHN